VELLISRTGDLDGLRGVVRATVLAACFWLAGAGIPHAALPQDQVDEGQLKAAVLFNFTKFVQWPPQQGPIVIGLAADDGFGDQLTRMAKGRQINGRDLVVRYLESDDDARACQMVFVSEGAARRAGAILRRVAGSAVLTVGESQGFLADGGHIRMYLEQNRIRFQINAANAERAGLKISAQLMTLSR